MSCLIIDDLLTGDREGLLNKKLMDFYEDYREYKKLALEEPLKPADWIIHTRGPAAQLLDGMLVEGFRRTSGGGTPILIDLTTRPRPATLTDARLESLLAMLRRRENLPKTWERLSRFDDLSDAAVTLLRQESMVNLGHLNILKGNLAEVFSMPIQQRVLVDLTREYPDAVLISGVRVLGPEGGASRLFSDNIIARWRNDGTMEILTVFEVKSGYQGGAAATEQIFVWTERRIDDGLRLEIAAGSEFFHVPGGARAGTSAVVPGRFDRAFTYNYDPDGAMAGSRVIGLISGERQIITALGQSQSGVDASFGTVARRRVLELGITSNELDYLVARLLLERYGAAQ